MSELSAQRKMEILEWVRSFVESNSDPREIDDWARPAAERIIAESPELQDDETLAGVDQAAAACATQGAEVMKAGGAELPGVVRLAAEGGHPVAELIGFVQSFYRMACELAVARGLDPDRPPHLAKVTETR